MVRYDELPIDGLKVMLHVLEARKAEVQSCFSVDGCASAICQLCTFSIAMALSKSGKHREAVPWAELSLYHAEKSEENSEEGNTLGGRSVLASRVFACEIQAKADLLTKSMEHYEIDSGSIENSDANRARREFIVKQLEEWTGSSGTLAPGI